jgi:hypothetical protein
MYLLSDPAMTAVEASAIPLDALPLATSPHRTLYSVLAYTWSSHTITVHPGTTGEDLMAGVPPVGVSGVPFVISVDGERVYLGAFMTQVSSIYFPGPTIFVEELTDETIRIQAGGSGLDPRDDPRVMNVMAESGKLIP